MTVEGEIFIVTQGRGNVKLGLVQVCVVPERDILDCIDSKEAKAKVEAPKAKRRYDLAQADFIGLTRSLRGIYI